MTIIPDGMVTDYFNLYQRCFCRVILHLITNIGYYKLHQ